MKKEVFFVLLVITFLVIISFTRAENNSTITGSTVTGEITQVLVLNLTVSGPPQLSILHPKNQTYISSQNLNLNFTVDDEEWIQYSLDSAPNVTITGNIKFNTTEGSHNLFLYANNSVGLAIRNVTFFVNSTKFTVKYSNYSNSHKGNSTDFNASSYADIQNLSNVILEHTSFGKIDFGSEIINLTDDLNPGDDEIAVDSNTNFSFNRIFINSTALPNFNKSATLILRDLTFTNPRILRDGSLCSSAICTEGSYSSGIFTFNVTSFSVYTTEETPSEDSGEDAGTGGGGSSGGGSGIILPKISKKGITISEEQISVSLKQGQVTTKKITIKNDDTKKVKVTIENQRLQDFVVIREEFFDLNPGESKDITLDIIARETTKPDLYLGTLLVKTEYGEKDILVAIEVESSGALLDARVEILNGYKKVLPGEELVAEIRLFNLGISGRVDVSMEYLIKDYEGNEINLGFETLAIETQVNFLKHVKIPEDVEYGDYVFYTRAIYHNEVASASDSFEIVQYKVSNKEKIYIVSVVILGILFAMFIYHIVEEKIRPSGKIKRVGIRSIIKKR